MNEVKKIYLLRIGVMGSEKIIRSTIDVDEFTRFLTQEINLKGADPNWTGLYVFEYCDDQKLVGADLKDIIFKRIYVRIRSIDFIEEFLSFEMQDD